MRTEKNENIERVYKNLYSDDDNKTTKFNIINIDLLNILERYPGNGEITYYKDDTNSVVFLFNTIAIKIF
jgi:hypothetical protein